MFRKPDGRQGVKRIAAWKMTYSKPKELAPEICIARWHYKGVSSRDQARRPEYSENSLVTERTSSKELGMLLGLTIFIVISVTFLSSGIYLLVSFQDILFGILLILFTSLPTILFTVLIIGAASTLYYNSKFTPPCLTFNRTSLVPGSTVLVLYSHRQKNARRTVHGFVLTELVAATHTHLPGTSADGPSTDTCYQILWSSGVETHTINPNTAGMTFEQVIEIPGGFPDTGPLPLEGKELEKEAVWYFRVYEVTLPRASCEYEFILPVGGTQHESPGPPQASQSLRSIGTGQNL